MPSANLTTQPVRSCKHGEVHSTVGLPPRGGIIRFNRSSMAVANRYQSAVATNLVS